MANGIYFYLFTSFIHYRQDKRKRRADAEEDEKMKLSERSLKILSTVKPDLQKVVSRAIEISEVDFGVTCGNRTQEEQNELYAKGRTREQLDKAGLYHVDPKLGPIVTWTLNSNHIGGNAVDLLPYINGKAEWDNNGKLGLWPKIAKAMKQAANELNIPITWGGDWQKTPDRPHFELKN